MIERVRKIKLKGIDLSGDKPKALRAINSEEENKKAGQNKKHAVTKNDRMRVHAQINLSGRGKKKKKRATYIDECLAHSEKFKNMSAIEQVEYKHKINCRIYSRSSSNADKLKPIYDPNRKISLNTLLISRINEVLSPSLFSAVLSLAAYTDRIDGRLRSSGKTLLSVAEIAEIIGSKSRENTIRTLKELSKAECIKMIPIGKSEFIEIAQCESIKSKNMRKYILGLGNKEYAIYINPFFIFMKAYTDKDICEKCFFGSEWGLYNTDYGEIKKFIEEKCE